MASFWHINGVKCKVQSFLVNALVLIIITETSVHIKCMIWLDLWTLMLLCLKQSIFFQLGKSTMELSSIVLEIPNYAYKTLSRNLIGCSTLSQENCRLIGWYWKIVRTKLWTLTCPIPKSNRPWKVFQKYSHMSSQGHAFDVKRSVFDDE